MRQSGVRLIQMSELLCDSFSAFAAILLACLSCFFVKETFSTLSCIFGWGFSTWIGLSHGVFCKDFASTVVPFNWITLPANTPPTKNTQHSNSKDKISFFIFILQKIKNLNSDHYFVPNNAKNPPPTREINAITKITIVMILKVLLLFIFLI